MEKPWVVLKFGGTSLGNPENLVRLPAIVGLQCSDVRLVLVCSATSSVSKSSGTTSLLMEASKFDHSNTSPNANATILLVDLIMKNHLELVNQVIFDKSIKVQLDQQ